MKKIKGIRTFLSQEEIDKYNLGVLGISKNITVIQPTPLEFPAVLVMEHDDRLKTLEYKIVEKKYWEQLSRAYSEAKGAT